MNRRHRLLSVRGEALYPPCVSLFIRRGTSAPMPGQSDKLGYIRPTPDGPPSGDVGTGNDTGTSESADERRKPQGNDGTRRFEDRSTGYLAWPAKTAPRWGESPTRTRPLHEPETPNPARCGAGVGILALQAEEDVNDGTASRSYSRQYQSSAAAVSASVAAPSARSSSSRYSSASMAALQPMPPAVMACW